MHEVFPDMA
jgi:hypothetical protein